MEPTTTLSFKVQRYNPVTKKKEMVPPRWRKIETDGDKCPVDGSTMVVHPGKNMFARCLQCGNTYVAE